MNTRKLRKIGFISALLLSAITMSAVAQQRGANCNRGEGQKTCQRIPDLSEEQKAEMTKFRTVHLKEMQTFKADIGVLKAELNKLEIADVADQKAIDAKIDEISVVKTKMAKQASRQRQQVRSLLNDEQKVFFDAHSRKGKGRGNGHGPRNGIGNKECLKG